MVTPNSIYVGKSKNISPEINDSYTKIDKYIVTSNVNEGSELINTVSSKNYQTLIDRFRRKDLKTTVTTDVSKNALNIEDDYDINFELEDESIASKLDNNSMEKLRFDEATRTKIFNDFSKTVKGVSKNQSKFETPEDVTIPNRKEKVDQGDTNVTDDLLELSILNPTSYQIPSNTGVQQTTRTGFLDGVDLLE
ncbi:unnamed protein product [Arctia plantaginis]|uniref:Uncharacterized protein n=1 Tax=Arctia plantaginis TaxID=874455 RepID=A0A8S1A2W9_ARCPL|nr:unnamed protein product [Arctia plantaginis]